jgi:hypothetical protein
MTFPTVTFTDSNNSKITPTPTTYNPYASGTQPGWYYYLYNNTGTAQTIDIKVTSSSTLTVYFCLVAPGGKGGAVGESNSYKNTDIPGGNGGGGGGGQVYNYSSANTDYNVSLSPIGSYISSTLTDLTSNTTYIASYGNSGGSGSYAMLDSNYNLTNSGKGGDGGNGGNTGSVGALGGGGGNGGNGGAATTTIVRIGKFPGP